MIDPENSKELSKNTKRTSASISFEELTSQLGDENQSRKSGGKQQYSVPIYQDYSINNRMSQSIESLMIRDLSATQKQTKQNHVSQQQHTTLTDSAALGAGNNLPQFDNFIIQGDLMHGREHYSNSIVSDSDASLFIVDEDEEYTLD